MGTGMSGLVLPYTPVAVAEAIAERLDAAAAARGRCSLAIPGGRSPGPVLSELARLATPFLRDHLHLLWVDERAVPVGDEQRNDQGTLAAWESGGLLPAHVHPMPAEDGDLAAAAARYTETLATATGGGVLDVAFLGIGEDGHVASLFPDHSGLDELDPVLVVSDSPKPPAKRLSLSLGVLRQTEAKVVLALGEAKGRVMAAARQTADRTLPVSLLGDGVIWFADDAAMAGAKG